METWKGNDATLGDVGVVRRVVRSVLGGVKVTVCLQGVERVPKAY